MPHRQVWTTVNAPVDAGVLDLVKALSAFPKLETIESCQGDSISGSWICFRYGNYWNNSWKELSEFVLVFLGPGLAAKIGDRARVSIHVTECGNIQGELSVQAGAVKLAVSALRQLRRNYSI